MNAVSSGFWNLFLLRVSRLFFASIALLATGLAVGCSTTTAPMTSISTGGTGTTGNTSVTVLASSTANDQLARFDITITSLTLTSQSGNTVPVFTTPQKAEFIHLNGLAEPVTTVSIPQDTYTTATATVGSAQFICVGLDSSGDINNSTFAYGTTPTSQATVTVPTPIVG